MNNKILNTGVQTYIRNFSGADIVAVLLQNSIFEGLENKELVQQIESRRKCKKKLPTWYDTDQIYYPKKQAIEQSSSEITAMYKAQLISGKTLVDLTGGLGVDTYFFSKQIDQVIYCERQKELFEIATYNFTVLGATNINSSLTDGIDFLKGVQNNYNWVYLDPSRRKDNQKRVFLLGDAEPALPGSLQIIWKCTSNVLIKTSPLLDIDSGIKQLGNVREVHVVAINNEVKELLWVLEKDFSEEPIIKTINIRKDRNQLFEFKPSEEKNASCGVGPPGAYLYEPNAALLKAGAFKLLADKLNLIKLQENTHLYSSEMLLEFPGRRFEIINAFDYNKKKIRQLSLNRANISTRNFPISVKELRARYRIADGGDNTLFFIRDFRGKLVVLLCSVISES